MGIKSTLLTATALVLSSNINAATISIDWQSTGDGLITRDTSSGLDWLDLTQTTGMTYDSVIAGQVAGGQFDGWRYASVDEVNTLLKTNFGIDLYASNFTVGPMPAGLATAISFLGDTSSSGNAEWTGITGVTNQKDADRARHLSVGAEYWTTTQTFFNRVDPNLNTSYRWDNSFYNGSGSWLVATTPWEPAAVVPVPAAVWLLGSGLIGLIGIARRKKY